MDDFRRQLRDYRLTTAEILYHMPDHPGLLQTFVWQDLDIAPRFPILRRFLAFLGRKPDGRLSRARGASAHPIPAAEVRYARGPFTLQ